MDTKLERHQKIIRTILRRYAGILNRRSTPHKTTEIISDTNGNHYMLNTIGWQGNRRIWQTIVYVRIRDNKFWIEIDGLEDGITPDLLANGVLNEDIVLAFHPPTVRPFTQFAVA